MNKLGIYVHIPFCISRCGYCGFHSNAIMDAGKEGGIGYPAMMERINRYPELLIGEIREKAEKYRTKMSRDAEAGVSEVCQGDKTSGQGSETLGPGSETSGQGSETLGPGSMPRREARVVDTIFIGGGTPSAVSGEAIQAVVGAIRESFVVATDAEITIEVNPGTLNPAKLKAYRDCGVNRISIGVQSFDDEVLANLGRMHRSGEAEAAFKMARAAGFENINLDLMFAIPGRMGESAELESPGRTVGSAELESPGRTGSPEGPEIPGQTFESWMATVDKAIELGPEHISFYSLQIEEDTPFYRAYVAGDLMPTSDEEDRRMYHSAIEKFKAAGYEHYEISNVAKPGMECRHNLKYWSFDEYLGIGESASSFVDGIRFTEEPRRESHENDFEDDTSEFVFTGLRKMAGISKEEFARRFGRDFWEVFGDRRKYLEEFFEKGDIIEEGDNIRLSEKGIDISNTIMSMFV